MPVFVERRHSLFLNGKRDGFNRNSYVRRDVLLGVCSPSCSPIEPLHLGCTQECQAPTNHLPLCVDQHHIGLGPSPECGGLVLHQGALGHSPWTQPAVGPLQGCVVVQRSSTLCWGGALLHAASATWHQCPLLGPRPDSLCGAGCKAVAWGW